MSVRGRCCRFAEGKAIVEASVHDIDGLPRSLRERERIKVGMTSRSDRYERINGRITVSITVADLLQINYIAGSTATTTATSPTTATIDTTNYYYHQCPSILLTTTEQTATL